jgi:hypothetical protein
MTLVRTYADEIIISNIHLFENIKKQVTTTKLIF